MKKYLVISLFITTVISSFSLFIFYGKDISCTGNVTFIKGKEQLSLVVGHKMNDGKGLITLSGTFDHGNNEPLTISKIVHFSYHQFQGVVTAQSTAVQDSPANEVTYEEVRDWLPDFFFRQGGKITWVINKTGVNTWLFFSNPVPLYLCEK